MGTLEYALVPGGRKRLKILYTGVWETAQVEVDGETLWSMDTQAQIQRGQRIPLPDGSELFLKLAKAYGATELNVLRDGIAVPGSPSDPTEQAHAAVYLLVGFAVVTAGLALAAEELEPGLAGELSLGWPSLGVAFLYGLLGYFTRRRSRNALVMGIGVFVLDSLAVLLLSAEETGVAAISVLFLRTLLVVPLLRAVPAVEALARNARVAAMRAADEARRKPKDEDPLPE